MATFDGIVIHVGDYVKHRGTRQWGKILKIVPQRDKTSELNISRIKRREDDSEGEGWWATYHLTSHLSAHEVTDESELLRYPHKG